MGGGDLVSMIYFLFNRLSPILKDCEDQNPLKMWMFKDARLLTDVNKAVKTKGMGNCNDSHLGSVIVTLTV